MAALNPPGEGATPFVPMYVIILAVQNRTLAYSSDALPRLSISLVEGSTADAKSGEKSLRCRVRAEASRSEAVSLGGPDGQRVCGVIYLHPTPR